MFLDKSNFPRILTPRVRYPQDPSTIPTRSRLWSLPGSPVALRCYGHPAHVSWVHFPPRNFSPGSGPQWGKGGNNTHNSHQVPVPEVWLQGRHGDPPRLVPYVSWQNEFFPNTDPTGPVPTGPFYNLNTVPALKFAWLSRGVLLLGAPGTRLLCPLSPWGSIERIFP